MLERSDSILVELIPKKHQQAFVLPRWTAALFPAAIVFFVISLALWGGASALKGAAKKDLADTKQRIEEVRSPERRALEARLLAAKKTINDAAVLLKDHPQLTRVFSQTEQTTHPLVWFSEFSFNREKLSLKFSGQAEDFTVLGQQMAIFGENEFIGEAILSDLSFTEDKKVTFAVDLLLRPDIFTRE